MQRILLLAGCLLVIGGVLALPLAAQTGMLSGVVNDAQGPVAGAHVRIRATDNVTFTDTLGRFALETGSEGQEIELTAWASGYYIASVYVIPPAENITLTLRPYHTTDNPDYNWVLPESDESGACDTCHPMIVSQWANNGHGGAISNPRFFSLYNGTDLSGAVQVTPGYLTDFPDTAGNCANCHAPGAAVDGYLSVNMNDVRGDVAAGIHCDYCHKVGGVYINPATQLPYPNVPGVQSQRLLRPPQGDNIFFGPYDDIHDPDTYLLEISESIYCTPCHEFSMWGTPIYESYSEWLASPYADIGITCQDCHMPPTGDSMFALAEGGGLEHPPESIPSHLQLGATSHELLQNTVEMNLDAQELDGQITVTVTIRNSGAGHHIPTDFPGRHIILLVTTSDQSGQILPLQNGSVLPEWVGPEAGLPGKAYAKLLRDIETGVSPVVTYWRQTSIASDNRLAAFESDTTSYTFSLLSSSADIQVTATLILRPVFYDQIETRGWDVPDITMSEITLPLSSE